MALRHAIARNHGQDCLSRLTCRWRQASFQIPVPQGSVAQRRVEERFDSSPIQRAGCGMGTPLESISLSIDPRVPSHRVSRNLLIRRPQRGKDGFCYAQQSLAQPGCLGVPVTFLARSALFRGCVRGVRVHDQGWEPPSCGWYVPIQQEVGTRVHVGDHILEHGPHNRHLATMVLSQGRPLPPPHGQSSEPCARSAFAGEPVPRRRRFPGVHGLGGRRSFARWDQLGIGPHVAFQQGLHLWVVLGCSS